MKSVVIILLFYCDYVGNESCFVLCCCLGIVFLFDCSVFELLVMYVFVCLLDVIKVLML